MIVVDKVDNLLLLEVPPSIPIWKSWISCRNELHPWYCFDLFVVQRRAKHNINLYHETIENHYIW